jgi:hypothetical protein
MSLDAILWFSASVAEAAVIALLLYRRVWRSFPIFSLYSVWTLLASIAMYAVLHGYLRVSHSGVNSAYVSVYLATVIVDSTILFGVLLELAWSVLRPVRSALPRGALLAVGVLILALGAAIWPFAAFPGANHMPPEVAGLMRLQQTFSILRVVIFLVLAGLSQVLSMGWRNRELQIATGLGFTSLVGVAVAMLHAHQSTWAQYSHWNELVVAGYLCSLVYWMASFAQQEEQRRAFSPQMEHLLLAMAGSAKAARIALADSGGRTGKLGPL